jgi:heterotetrameric sarcosine oxidase delta subunit
MLLIECPWCGPRQETEFSCGGEAHVSRPETPEATSDAEWADYLFMHANTKGPYRERWHHGAGCRRWFNVERDTATNTVIVVYRPGEQPPAGN